MFIIVSKSLKLFGSWLSWDSKCASLCCPVFWSDLLKSIDSPYPPCESLRFPGGIAWHRIASPRQRGSTEMWAPTQSLVEARSAGGDSGSDWRSLEVTGQRNLEKSCQEILLDLAIRQARKSVIDGFDLLLFSIPSSLRYNGGLCKHLIWYWNSLQQGCSFQCRHLVVM